LNIKLNNIISNLPSVPGVYQFIDKNGIILYVGKAKNLKKRVSSYFLNDPSANKKVRVLVSKIIDIKYLIVDSESDALLLENNLIKEYQPRYNILLKDDKTFPWICIKNERFPRIYYTRSNNKDGSEYFGPYTSVVMVKTILNFIKKLYTIRNCNYELSQEKIEQKKYKPCMEFHLGNCLAPCIGNQSIYQYNSNIKNIKKILKGSITDIIDYLNVLMKTYANKMDYENAQIIKNKIDIISNYRSKSTVVNSTISNVDVYSLIEQDEQISVNFLKVINGAIVQVHSLFLKRRLDERLDEILSLAILDIRQKMLSDSNLIIVPFIPDVKLPNVKYQIPKQGDKLKLLELSERNSKIFLNERLKISFLKSEKSSNNVNKMLKNLKVDMRLSKIPFHIECFDNSNLQGSNPVAACVVYKNGIPSKKDYRHFNIKSVIGPDDYESMREIVYRRYKSILDDNENLPDLIIVDGGKGQLSAAVDSLKELQIFDKINIIGIAKRLEEIFYPNDPVPLYINKNSSSLKMIQKIRNETHRFGINFHRLKRSKRISKSVLDQIKGIGIKTKLELFKKFNSVEKIFKATEGQLAAIAGQKNAKKIKEYYSSNN